MNRWMRDWDWLSAALLIALLFFFLSPGHRHDMVAYFGRVSVQVEQAFAEGRNQP